MKKSQLQQIIREEIQKVLKEAVQTTIKVGDTVGNTVQGFNFKVVKISGDKLDVVNKTTGKKLSTHIDNMYLPSDKAMHEANEMGAFRRVVIKSSKIDAIKSEIDKLMKRPDIKSGFPMNKFQVKDGAVPGVLVVDMEGNSATGLAAKINDIARKLDKAADVKIRKELKLTAVK